MVCLVSSSVEAAPVDAATAQMVASQCVMSSAAGHRIPSYANLRLAHAEPSATLTGASDYYVFNASDGSAFVIASGDDRAEQVLAYGDGTIDMANLPCNLAWMLDQYKTQIEWLHANPSARVETSRPLLTSDGDPLAVPPMLTCTWSQSAPYYDQCPIYNGKHCVTGCVATAMAQVMYFWRYPSRVPSLSGYRSRSGLTLEALPSKPIDWDNMLDSYSQGYTPEQGQAVALLMRYCGQSCFMSYSPDGSGAYVHDQLRGMKNFGYNHNAVMLERINLTTEQWVGQLKEDLAAGRPVLYAGDDPNAGGHAFVLDGYYNGKYHINWGWANTGNGYFALDAFIVRGYNFGHGHQMLHNVTPSVEPQVTVNHDFEQGGIYYKYNEDNTGLVVTNRDTKFNSYSGDVVIPSQVEVDGKIVPVTSIGVQAFRNCFGLTSVQLPEGITSIDRQAFTNCVALQTVVIPASVKTIGEMAFHDCVGLTRVETPSLDNWLDITFVEHYSNPLSYAHHLFAGGEEVTHLVIDGYVKPYAFIECYGLESLTINEGVTDMGVAAFSYCEGLKQLSLPSSMQAIAAQAFYGCTGLKSLTIPEGVESLGDAAFSSCSGLSAVMLPQSLVMIGNQAFRDCVGLMSIDFSDGLVSIGSSAFSGCSGLHSLSLPSGLVSIGPSAFSSCSSLTAVTVPDGVTILAEHAFEQCASLASVTLGRGLEQIGNKAFANCQMISMVKCRALAPPELASSECFYRNVYRKATLYVPYDSYDAYKHATLWPWFIFMYGIDVDHEPGDVNGDGEITIADINAVIDAIVNTPERSYRFDVNHDREVNIADINALIDMILSGD